MNRSLRAMLHNYDDSAKSLVAYICEIEGYPWEPISQATATDSAHKELPTRFAAFDRIEFGAWVREIDVAIDIAFLVMGLVFK